jgi:hypothetical protein
METVILQANESLLWAYDYQVFRNHPRLATPAPQQFSCSRVAQR